MIGNIGKKIKRISSKIFFALIFILSIVFLPACEDNYANMSITLSNNGQQVYLTIEDGTSSTETVVVTVNAVEGISKQVQISTESPLINIETELNENNATAITLTASGACTNVLVSIKTLEGNKTASFYVTVIIPVTSITAIADETKLFAVKGGSINLSTSQLFQLSPSITTQRDLDFILYNTDTTHANIVDGVLTVDEDFTGSTVTIKAFSSENENIYSVVSLVVVDVINEDSITYTAKYYGTSTVINDLSSSIMLAKNVVNKNAVEISLQLEGEDINITPYIKSTLSSTSSTISFINKTKLVADGKTTYTFIVKAESLTGTDRFFFFIKYNDFNYYYSTNEINIETYEAITSLQCVVDGVIAGSSTQTISIYDKYIGVLGMELQVNTLPSTLVASEKQLILTLGTNASAYNFYTASGNEITFTNGKYTYNGGEKIYVKAKQYDAEPGIITISAQTNSAISKTFTLNAKAGVDEISFTNATTDSLNRSLYFLTSNTVQTQSIKFSIATTDVSTLAILSSGSSLVVDSRINSTGEINEYSFDIRSIFGASDEVSAIIVRHANGCYAEARVEVFHALEETDLSFGVPTAQSSASVGLMKTLTSYNSDISPNLQFFVAIKKNNAITLTKSIAGASGVVYTYCDYLLGDSNAEEDYDYKYYMENSISDGVKDLTFADTSSILNTLYLTSFGQLYGNAVGKVWVKASVNGFTLEEGVKTTISFDFYFLVESYIPITEFTLSQSTLNLYSKSSVGYEDSDETFGVVNVSLSNNSTYSNIEWTSNKGLNYQLNQQQIYIFEDNQSSVKVTAYNTLVAYESGGTTQYKTEQSLTFFFIAKITEFNTTYVLTLKVNIIRAQQVEKILLENVNVNTGIYIPLKYDGEAISRQISATVQIGESGVVPHNTNLVYEFLPFANTGANILSLNKTTGLLTISGSSTQGGAGYIRVAPADRYDYSGTYIAGETDVAVYFKIVIADGRSRETAYQITSLNDIKNFVLNTTDEEMKFNLHYVLMNSVAVETEDDFVVCENFAGGLYGALVGESNYSTIQTNKPLFKILSETANIADLVLVGNIIGAGAVAEENNGTINNITIDTLSSSSIYLPSTITLASGEFAGGIVAKNFGEISNCNFFGQIDASASIVGGISGYNAGDITNCKVEIYNFQDEENTNLSTYAHILGSTYVGGLIGTMNGGNLTNSYFQSYAKTVDGETTTYVGLNILSGGTVGALIGNLIAGSVDICFAYANDITTITGNSYVGNLIDNAYLLYHTDNTETLSGYYIYNQTKNYNIANITNDNVWAVSSEENNSFPYFKNLAPQTPLQSISDTLSTDDKHIISTTNASIIYYYATSNSLTLQEKTVLNALNFILFSDMLGENSYGIRAISSDNTILSVFSNGLQVNGNGIVTVKIFSKYDYSISQTFTIYVVYPIVDFNLYSNNIAFGDGSELNVKITNGFSFIGQVDDEILLDANNVLILINNLSLDFSTYATYLSGDKLGPIVIDTSTLYDNTLLDEVNIIYNILLSNQLFTTEQLEGLNAILTEFFEGTFKLNLYKGADRINISSTSAQIEPSDEVVVDCYLYSDVAKTDDLTGEDIAVYMTNANLPTDLFVVTKEYIGSVYYLSKTDLTQITTEEENAVYYLHQFKLTFSVNNKYKDYAFDANAITFIIYAKTSQTNAETYNTDLVRKTFSLTVNPQSILSINATHYAVKDKSLRYVESKNVVHYSYQQTSTSVITPGEEGMLEINLYPNYSRYDYIDITYETQTGDDFALYLGILSKQLDGTFTRSSVGFSTILNGIRISNLYEFNEAIANPLTTLYLSTYLPYTIEKDTVFVITLKAYSSDEIVKESTFNLIVQYLEGAIISVQNDDGESLKAVAKGSTEKLIITVQKDQTLNLDKIIISGYNYENKSSKNYVSYSSFEIIEDENSLTRTYVAYLYIGEELELLNNSNLITIQATISWIINGRAQTKITSISLGVVDFVIGEISLLTDKEDKTNLKAYIGVETNLQFDFNGNYNESTNQAFNTFLANHYFISQSNVNEYGNYVVNYEKDNLASFMGNLYYVSGGTTTPILNQDGTFKTNEYFSINVVNGTIKIIGKKSGDISLKFILPIQYPSKTTMVVQELEFDFTITITIYSDESTPLVIDSETAFVDALNGENAQNYILMSDLYLYDYSPYSTNGLASLDGNNYVINIMSWNEEITGSSLYLALFNEVNELTTLKNLAVNIYHATNITVNTTQYTDVQVAGLAINNYGIIYNCAVIAYRADLSKSEITKAGFNLTYSGGQIDSATKSVVAGFVVQNSGYITNSRVGGETFYKVNSGNKELSTFNITAQGDISGFVYENYKYIASSSFSNGTIINLTTSGIETHTSGFASLNTGKINSSYAKGTGTQAYSLTGAGISTSSISAGFIYNNNGTLADCYANILLASTSANSTIESGRLSAGFVYKNIGTVERCYTASKIQDAKSTQMAFVGIDESGLLLNSGLIDYCYYYAPATIEGDAYVNASSNINIVRVLSPDDQENFYGLTFADSASSINGVWFSTAYGINLVSANQIAISNRYLANEKRDSLTQELISYNLPYTSGYEYGSVQNPIIIRSANEFNTAFGGNASTAGTAISSYYNLDNSTVFGNYRLITNIDLLDLATDDVSGIKIQSTTMTLKGGVIDGNMLNISGLDLTAQTDLSIQNYGLFAKLTDNAIIMNLNVKVVSVSAKQAQYVGAIAGSVENSKLIHITLTNASGTKETNIIGNNIVGGLVGKVQGDSEVRNITATSINVKANNLASGAKQTFNRNLNNLTNINTAVSYAGGIIGVADIYSSTDATSLYHKTEMEVPNLAYLEVNGIMQIRGSTVGGICGYIGPQTYLKDTTLELTGALSQKIIAYNFYAGGIVGENYGDIDMARTQHDNITQKLIEDGISDYYHNVASTTIERGNLTFFEDSAASTYSPKAIGGIVGQLNTGSVTHSYSKINVCNSKTTYAGGIIGEIAYITSSEKARNLIEFFEVYSFGDVSTNQNSEVKAGAGGIIGYIDYNRKITFNKVNAVNYYTLLYNEENDLYYLPTNTYQIYALTGSANPTTVRAPQYLSTIARNTENTITMKEGYENYLLPTISATINGDDMFAITQVKFTYNNVVTTTATKESYATLTGSTLYNMIYANQGITSFYDLTSPNDNGIVMDTYFDKSDWDKNYWIRYSTDLLPSLVTYNESNLYYIDVAQDLQKMLYHPNATFIVRALNQPSTIVKVGKYIKTTGLILNNFTGVLKGLDNTLNYGLDFEGEYSFIQNTSSGAKIYNLTLKNIGSSSSSYSESTCSFVGSAIQTTFENLLFEDCFINAYATVDNSNIGILANQITGGYVSNISFEDCSVSVLAKEKLTTINVGMLCGLAQTQGNAYLQILDITAYLSSGFTNTNIYNRINVSANGFNITNYNVGAIAGQTIGAVLLNYTSVSTSSTEIKGVGIKSTTSTTYIADSVYNSVDKGIVISVNGTGNIGSFNAGLIVGKINTMTISYQRANTYQKLNIVGGIKKNGTAVIETANLGGVVGFVESVVSISNGSTFIDKYVAVDADINLTANKTNAGMLIGSCATVNSIDNIDTYGTINVKSTNGASNIGGFVGIANADISIQNAISRTAIIFEDTTTNDFAKIGGLVGLFNSTTSSLTIGEGNYNTKYLGTITIKGKNVYVGGLLGGAITTTGTASSDYRVTITSAVFGGKIIINQGLSVYCGGLLGTSKVGNNNELAKYIENNLSYGDIAINCDLSTNESVSYVGGIIGQGSETTHIESNYSVATITSSATQTSNKLIINAMVGNANGSLTNDMNYYSHQVSLCLDINETGALNGFKCENVYYYTNNGLNSTLPTILSVLTEYKAQLTNEEKLNEIYYGSKIDPFLLNANSFSTLSSNFTNVYEGRKKYFVINGQLTTNMIKNFQLVNCHIIGDGFSLTNTTDAVFGLVDANSIVSGVKVIAEISATNATAFGSQSGIGTLANVNNGKIYSCISTEAQSADVYGVNGLSSTAVGVYVGGLVGVNNGQILDSTSDIDILATSATVGGLVGYNNGLISNSYSTGFVSGANAYSFGTGSVNGKLFYCYTASPTTATGSTQVFGDNTTQNCYYDLYATGVYQSKTGVITSDTKTMSIIELQDAEEEQKAIFLQGELENMSALVKFNYNYTKNYGYLSFSGTAYANFTYLQNLSTGTGSEIAPMLIATAGKLQQINYASNTANNYKLVADISVTDDMATGYEALKDIEEEDGFDETFNVANWDAIGKNATVFTGTLTGLYSTDQKHKIVNIGSNSEAGITNASIFGITNNAEISNLEIENSILTSSTATNIAGLVAVAENTTISDIDFAIENITYTAENAVKMGGIVAYSKGDTIITNCVVNGISITYGSSTSDSSSSASYVGAFVGYAENSMGLTNSSLTGTNAITIYSKGSANVGGLVGYSNNITASSTNIYDCEITDDLTLSYITSQNATGISYLGTVIGYSKSAFVDDIAISASATISYTATSSSTTTYLGGIAGYSYDSAFDFANVGTLSDGLAINYNSTGTLYAGGLAGAATNNSAFSSIELGSNYQFNYVDKSTANSKSNYMGGLIGQVNSTYFDDITAGDAYSLNYNAVGTNYMGGLFGETATGTTTIDGLANGSAYGLNYFLEGIETGESTTFGENYMGGLVGKAVDLRLQNSSSEFITVANPAITYAGSGDCHIGGIAGELDNSTITKYKVDNFDVNGSDVKASVIGGVASVIKSSTLTNLQIANCDFSLKGNGFAGGVAGIVETGTSTFTKVNIISLNITDKALADASYLDSAIGGIVGKSNSTDLSILGCVVDSGSDLTSNSCAGGILGYGSVNQINKYELENIKTINNATIEVGLKANETATPVAIPYAGGIVGYLVAGSITDCVNTGSVTAGWNNEDAIDITKVTQTELEALGSGITQLRAGEFLGSTISYAGGIAGYSASTAIITLSSNISLVQAIAKLSLSINKYMGYQAGEIYYANCYYGVQEEKAYANGIAYTANSSETFADCTGNGVVEGGEKLEFNMFYSTPSNAPAGNEFYILDYGFSNTNLYATWGAYTNDFNAQFGFGALAAWKASGLEMVLFESGGEYQQAVDDYNRPLWYYFEGEQETDLYYITNDREDLDLYKKVYIEDINTGEMTTTYELYTGTKYPTPATDGSGNPITTGVILSSTPPGKLYYNSKCNNDAYPAISTNSLIGQLSKTLDSSIDVLRNYSADGSAPDQWITLGTV